MIKTEKTDMENSMDNLIQLLKSTDIFVDFPENILENDILPRKTILEFQKGQFIIEPQQIIRRFAVVISGRIQILHIFPEGNYSLMAAMTTGEIVGADLVCTKSQISPYHVIAAEVTRLMFFPVEILTQPGTVCESYRLMALNRLLALISHENMRKEYRLAILSQKGLRERIITYLTMQASRLGKSSFTIPFSREELAAFLCVNRSALSHELSLMEQEGLIAFRKNVFTLLKLINPSPSLSSHTLAQKYPWD